jgi:hypothetical protein
MWMAWRRDGAGRAVLLVLLLAALGNMLLTFPGWTARYSVTLPFLPLITAAGFMAAWRGVTRLAAGRAHMLGRIAWAGAALLALIPVGVYFGPHLDLYNEQIRPDLDHQDIAWRARDLPPGTHIFVITDEPVFIPHVDILSRYWVVSLDITWVTPLVFATRGGASRLPHDAPLALFVEPSERETLNYLARVFDLPPAQWSPYDVPRDKQYVLFVVGES